VNKPVGPVGPGWLADPLGPPGRLRWWDGARWTARVTPLGEESRGLSWRPELAVAAQPGPEPDSEAPIRVAAAAIAPVAGVSRVPDVTTIDPLVAAFGTDATWPVPIPVELRTGPRRRHAVTALAAGAVLALGAGAGAGILDDAGRPEFDTTTAYRDPTADFALRYPNQWRVDDEQRGALVRFLVGEPGAPLIRTNTVTVSVGEPTQSPLPKLGVLATTFPEMMRAQFPGIELEEAGEARLLGAPARRLQLADTHEDPAIRVLAYAGATTTGRPLSVVIVVREPRTAPTPPQVRSFIRSLVPA
jgi:hypothetical protein